MYRQQQDYVQGKTGTAARVLIVGDSRTKAGMDPALLWEGSYNIALGGTTPIEGYYALKEYIETHADDLPQTVVIAYAPMHYMDVDTLWTRCIYFHTLRSADFSDLVSRAKSFQNTEHILIDHCRLEYLQYKFYMPNKYATALKKRYSVNADRKTFRNMHRWKQTAGIPIMERQTIRMMWTEKPRSVTLVLPISLQLI